MVGLALLYDVVHYDTLIEIVWGKRAINWNLTLYAQNLLIIRGYPVSLLNYTIQTKLILQDTAIFYNAFCRTGIFFVTHH